MASPKISLRGITKAFGPKKVLQGIDGLGFVHLSGKDVVRHRIVQDIVNAYEQAGGSTS